MKGNSNMKFRMRASFTGFLAVVLISCMLSACGSTEQADELSAYHGSVDSFFDKVAACSDYIDTIDPDSEDAPGQFLAAVDELKAAIDDGAQLDAPEEFENAQEMCRQAAFYMDAAAEQYHLAFESEAFDSQAFANAQDYMNESFGRLDYMVTFLHGEIPEGMTVTEDTE